MFDSEGTIRFRRKGSAGLQVCSGNTESLLEAKKILEEDFSIYMKIIYNQSNVTLIYTDRYNDIKKFADKINFTIKRKKEKLAFCLSSYKRKGLRKYNQDFKANVLQLLSQGFSAYKINRKNFKLSPHQCLWFC